VSDPQGLVYDRLAEDYDLGRAGWPPELLDGVDGETVLDLAAGTGKLTAVLVGRFSEVIAVEPLAGMRAILERSVPGALVLPGNAEQIPVDDDSVDAAFVAEAFHWFDSAAAVRELARVLRPGGTLVVCFNQWQGFVPAIGDDVRAALREAYNRLPAPGGSKVESGAWQRGFDEAPFGPLAERAIEHEWTTDRDGVAACYVSTSSMGALPEDERLALRERIVAALPDVSYRLPLVARVFTTERC
jgi:SAM-dependent methyltransferase